MFCSLSLLCRVVKCGSVGWSSVGVWECGGVQVNGKRHTSGQRRIRHSKGIVYV